MVIDCGVIEERGRKEDFVEKGLLGWMIDLGLGRRRGNSEK